MHHIIPSANGGADDLDNLTTLCKPCHGNLKEPSNKGYNRNKPITLYVSDEEEGQIKSKADSMGLSVSSYVRVKALEGDKK